jgi:hypothetical protein
LFRVCTARLTHDLDDGFELELHLGGGCLYPLMPAADLSRQRRIG